MAKDRPDNSARSRQTRALDGYNFERTPAAIGGDWGVPAPAPDLSAGGRQAAALRDYVPFANTADGPALGGDWGMPENIAGYNRGVQMSRSLGLRTHADTRQIIDELLAMKPQIAQTLVDRPLQGPGPMPMGRLTEAMGILPEQSAGMSPESASPMAPGISEMTRSQLAAAGPSLQAGETAPKTMAAMLPDIGSASAASPYRIPNAPLSDDPDAVATAALRERLGLGANAPGGDPLLADYNMRRRGYSYDPEQGGWHDPNRDASAETSQDVINRMSAWDQVEKSMNAVDKSGDPTPEQLVRARGIQRGLQREGVPLGNAMAQGQMMSGITGAGGMSLAQAAQMGPEGFAKFEELANMQQQFADQLAFLDRAREDAVRAGDADRALAIDAEKNRAAALQGSLSNQLLQIWATLTGQREGFATERDIQQGAQGVQRFGIEQGARTATQGQLAQERMQGRELNTRERMGRDANQTQRDIGEMQYLRGPAAQVAAATNPNLLGISEDPGLRLKAEVAQANAGGPIGTELSQQMSAMWNSDSGVSGGGIDLSWMPFGMGQSWEEQEAAVAQRFGLTLDAVKRWRAGQGAVKPPPP